MVTVAEGPWFADQMVVTISKHDRSEARRYVDSFLRARFLSSEVKDDLVEKVADRFETRVLGNLSTIARITSSDIRDRTRRHYEQRIQTDTEQEIKGDFGLSFIIMAIAGFLIQKLLEFLWERYVNPTVNNGYE